MFFFYFHFYNKKMRVWCTSDLINIPKDELLYAWNSNVGIDDEVFILGSYGKTINDINFLIDDLNGKKGFFIASKKDKIILEYSNMFPNNKKKYSVFTIPFINMENGPVLSYYPFINWDEKKAGKIQYYGDSETAIYNDQNINVSWLNNGIPIEIKESYVK